MVPSNYASFFDAASQAGGALIGLLFVVIALKPGKIVGDRAEPTSRSLAGSSSIGLVNAFFVSLLALIPGHHNIGIGAAIVAAISLYRTVRLSPPCEIRRSRRRPLTEVAATWLLWPDLRSNRSARLARDVAMLASAWLTPPPRGGQEPPVRRALPP
jgi:hypothetical protein